MIDTVLIVGASVAGVGAANELRRCGFAGRIVLADSQPHLPYDRPPLSKAALADLETPVFFHDAGHYEANNVELLLGAAASSLSSMHKRVTFADGTEVEADAIILATGARARKLPAAIADGPIHVIRDLDDAAALRPFLQPGRSLAMIGGGFIGAESAATASKLGVDVTIFDLDPVPMARILGLEVAKRVNALHEEAGVELVCGTGVARIERDGEKSAIVLSDGRRRLFDIVVAGLGSVPNLEWLEIGGIGIGDGILCDAFGHTSREGIYAAGDVAAWTDPITGERSRHEHWTAAREQARIVAQQIVGVEESVWKEFIPYFWSDIHGKRVQLLGHSADATSVEFVFEKPETGAFVAEYRRDGRLIGVAGCNSGARVMRYSPQLARG